MTKNELEKRVAERKEEILIKDEKLTEILQKVTEFVEYIKSKSTIFALLKNTKIWKELIQISEP